MRKLLLFIWVAIVVIACNGKQTPKDLLPFKTMQTVVWQLMKADEVYTRVSPLDSTWRKDRKNVQFYQQIFDYNKVDRVQFYKTIDYLERHPVEFKELLDSVNELSKREKNETIIH
jgi:hypothetical protein